jgi:hypothetical protein
MAVALCAAAPVRAQAGYARFDVTGVADTTFTIATGNSKWVKHGQRGLAVDPAHGDVLIATFRVMQVHHGSAIALITGQTARLTTAHVALLRTPTTPFYAKPWFWAGVAGGFVIGFVAHH